MNPKQKIRKKILGMRSLIDGDDRIVCSKKIVQSFIDSLYYIKAETIMVYLPIRQEVDTEFLIKKALWDGKQICVPVTEKGSMYAAVYSEEQMTGEFGVSIPKDAVPVRKDKIDCIVVPGAVFDSEMNRIGYGKGFYDRFLIGCSAYKVGFCYDFQLIEKIESDSHDIKMDDIFHESVSIR